MTPSAEVLVIDGGSAAVEGERNSAAEGLRGICSLALPPSAGRLLVDSGDRKLCRRMSASLDAPLRRKKPCIIGMVGLKLGNH